MSDEQRVKRCSDCGGVLGQDRPNDPDEMITALYSHPSKRSMPDELLCARCFDGWLTYRQVGAHELIEPAYTLQDVTDAESEA